MKNTGKITFLVALLVPLLAFFSGCTSNNNNNPSPTPSSVPSNGHVSGKVLNPTPGPGAVNRSSLGNFPVAPLRHIPFKTLNVTDEKVVRFKAGLTETQIRNLVRLMGGTFKRSVYGAPQTYVISCTENAAATLKKHPDIITVEDNIRLYASTIRTSITPDDPYYSHQWNMTMLSFPSGWNVTMGDITVKVAVLDTGIATTHPEFKKPDETSILELVTGCDIVDGDNDPSDNEYYDYDNRYSHGSHVAGILGAVTNNGGGVAGVAWNINPNVNIRIMPIRVLDETGSGTLDNITAGINLAADNGANVINMSLGASADVNSPALNAALDHAIKEHNITVVAAAGNENAPVGYPARYPGVIAVAALGPDGNRASYSNFGPEIVISAPGGSGEPEDPRTDMILSTTFDKDLQINHYVYMCGTSMATPHIAGLAALLYAEFPGITPAQVRDRLTAFATDKGNTGFDNFYGYGLANAYAALTGTAGPINTAKVFYGEKNGTTGTVYFPDAAGNYTIRNIPKGDRHICAFLDQNMDGMVDPGDKFGFVNVTVEGGATVNAPDITLTTSGVAVSTTLVTFLGSHLP